MEKKERKRIAIISIMTYYAKQIFDETKLYEFRKSPLKKELLDKKIYVYSAKEDKAIIGYFKVSDILNGNTSKILELTGYDKRKDGTEIVDYFGGERGFEIQQERYKNKVDYCKIKNIKLIEIPYWEFDNIEKIIKFQIDEVIKC